MKSILLGFLAAVIGCIIFFLCLAGWYEMTGQGSGVSKRGSGDGNGSVVIVAQDTAGSGTGTSSGAASQGTSGTGSAGSVPSGAASQGTAGAGSAGSTPSGTGTSSGAGTSSGTGTSVDINVPLPGRVNEEAVNVYMGIIRKELEDSVADNEHVSVDRSARGITITFWEDELVSKLSEGQRDNSTQALWEAKKDKLRSISQSYAGRSASVGVTDTHIVANLLNERNRTDIILSYEDGTLIHDGLDHN